LPSRRLHITPAPAREAGAASALGIVAAAPVTALCGLRLRTSDGIGGVEDFTKVQARDRPKNGITGRGPRPAAGEGLPFELRLREQPRHPSRKMIAVAQAVRRRGAARMSGTHVNHPVYSAAALGNPKTRRLWPSSDAYAATIPASGTSTHRDEPQHHRARGACPNLDVGRLSSRANVALVADPSYPRLHILSSGAVAGQTSAGAARSGEGAY